MFVKVKAMQGSLENSTGATDLQSFFSILQFLVLQHLYVQNSILQGVLTSFELLKNYKRQKIREILFTF